MLLLSRRRPCRVRMRGQMPAPPLRRHNRCEKRLCKAISSLRFNNAHSQIQQRKTKKRALAVDCRAKPLLAVCCCAPLR